MNISKKDISGASVKFPPPLIFLLFMLSAYGADYLLAIEIINLSFLRYVGWFFGIAGFVILLVASISFKWAKTDIKPWKPTTYIISSGLFAYSRNPVYLAFCIVTIGAGLILNSLWVTLSFIPSIVVVFYYAIRREELYLEDKFGEDYLSYKNKVRRWL